IVAELNRRGIPAVFDLVGDGPEIQNFKALAAELSVQPQVRFHGWMARPQLPAFYKQAHFLLFPSTSSEGWPKALSEAMAHGAVPVAGMISSIPQYLDRFQSGIALDPTAIDSFVQAIESYSRRPDQWKQHSLNGVHSAHFFTYSSYLSDVQSILNISTPLPSNSTPTKGTTLGARTR